MVQRKIINKLAIQADHLKNENLDLKNGSMELKMKKSWSIKHPQFDRMPRKPNYMKSTTSSDARKEKTTVSIKTPKKNKKETKTFARITSLKMTSFKPARAKKCAPVAIYENLDAKRATCSSTMKDYKFPTYLTLIPGGTESQGVSTMKVCPYTYCSLNGHHHPALPPLKGFMSARRRVLKTHRSIKLGCLSPRPTRPTEEILKFEGPLIQEEEDDFFIEIYTPDATDLIPSVEGRDEIAAENHNHDESREAKEGEEDSSKSLAEFCEQDSEASDVDLEINQYPALYLDDDYEYPPKMEKEADLEGGVAENCDLAAEFINKIDHKIDSCYTEFLADDVSQESFYENSLSSDAWSSSDDSDYSNNLDDVNPSAAIVKLEEEPEAVPGEDETLCQISIASPQIGSVSEEETLSDNESSSRTPCEFQIDNSEAENVLKETSNEDEDLKTLSTMSPAKESHTKVRALDNAESPEMEDNTLNRVPVKCKKLTKDSNELGEFNPRGPNFLLLEPDPDAENVDLRHQELDEKKNAEEWMVDYALRQVVTKLGPARKKKVSLLVEAFEKVMPVTKYDIHLKHNSAFDHVRPIQACN